MPVDPILAKETRQWFEKAQRDLRAAQLMREASPPLLDASAYHVQQSVEKAMKGFLTWRQQPFRKTHSLVELGHVCANLDAQLTPLAQKAAPLTDYATQFRYPGNAVEPTVQEVDDALKIAGDVLARLTDGLPPEAKP